MLFMPFSYLAITVTHLEPNKTPLTLSRVVSISLNHSRKEPRHQLRIAVARQPSYDKLEEPQCVSDRRSYRCDTMNNLQTCSSDNKRLLSSPTLDVLHNTKWYSRSAFSLSYSVGLTLPPIIRSLSKTKKATTTAYLHFEVQYLVPHPFEQVTEVGFTLNKSVSSYTVGVSTSTRVKKLWLELSSLTSDLGMLSY